MRSEFIADAANAVPASPTPPNASSFTLALFASTMVTGLIAMSTASYAIPAQLPAPFQPVAPSGLSAGAHYRLVFESSATINATSADIATYNAFAAAQAALNSLLPTTTWSAIGSTSLVNAIQNIACTPSCASDPIFLVTGNEVATATASLFDGSLSAAGTMLIPINIDQSGGAGGAYAWTGSFSNGVASTNPLGNAVITGNDSLPRASAGSGSLNQYGEALNVGAGTFDFAEPVNGQLSIYAISGDLTVSGTAVPEPASLALLGGGILAALARRLRRRERSPAPQG